MPSDKRGTPRRDRVGWWPAGQPARRLPARATHGQRWFAAVPLSAPRQSAQVVPEPVVEVVPDAPPAAAEPVAEPAIEAPRWGPLVDLHSHVLPGVDDGARDLDGALAMLRVAVADGITAIAATPHADRCPWDQVVPGVERLNRAAREAGLDILVVPGSEARFSPDLPAQHEAGRLVTLNRTPYLLVESSLYGDFPPNLRQAIYDLQLAGIWPVLAHAERYPPVQRDPDVLLDLISAGVLVQINADSLASGRGHGPARHTAEVLLRRRMGHLIASDAHNTGSRPPRLQAALSRAAELTDDDYAAGMAATAAAILRGEPIEPPGPLLVAHTGWLSRHRHR